MRKRVKRKVWPLLDVVGHAIAGACITDKSNLDKLRLRELAAIDAMTKGLARVTEWNDLTDMLNLAETMGKNGIGPEVLEICEVAQNELYEAAKRYEKTKRMGLTGTGLQAVKDLFEFHDLQRSSIPRSDYEKMIQKTKNYIISNAPSVVSIT
jgi:hypothetical protein